MQSRLENKTMDVKAALNSVKLKKGDSIELTGWLVDKSEGLFILGDHFPESYDYPTKIKIVNQNIIYPILEVIPSLGGGQSLLFYKTKVFGVLVNPRLEGIIVEKIFIQGDRSSNHLQSVDISLELVNEFVEKYGDYQFDRPRTPMRDWLNDF